MSPDTHDPIDLQMFDRYGNRILWRPADKQSADSHLHVAILGIEGDDVAFVNVQGCVTAKVQHLTAEAFQATFKPL